jgi:hypothetical protein
MSTTKQKIAVMQAFEDGKAIQYRSRADSTNTWQLVDAPIWAWDCMDYREKPEPKTVMMQMWEDEDGELVARDTSIHLRYQERVGEPFEFTYPEESK